MSQHFQTASFPVEDRNPTGYSQVLEEMVPDEYGGLRLDKKYFYGHDLIWQIVWDANAPTLFTEPMVFGCDGHGNVRFLVNNDGEITDTYSYDAFGVLINQWHLTAATPNNYLYCGERFDGDLGLYHLRARYLNPNTGRFWTMDSYEGSSSDPRSLHKYLYSYANPINGTDPSGHEILYVMPALGNSTINNVSLNIPRAPRPSIPPPPGPTFIVPEGWSDFRLFLELSDRWGRGIGGDVTLAQSTLWKIAHRGQYEFVRRQMIGTMEAEFALSGGTVTRSEKDIGGYAEAWFLGQHRSEMTVTRIARKKYKVTLTIEDDWDFDENDHLGSDMSNNIKTIGSWGTGIMVKWPWWFVGPSKVVHVKGATTFEEDWL